MSTSVDTTTAQTTRIPETGVWSIEPSHSTVEATARHLMVTKVRGRFGSLAGAIHIGDDLTASRVEVTIDAATIATNNEDRDAHLRSADFLDVEQHPEIAFVSTGVSAAADGRYEVVGDLTIRGVSRPVTLAMRYLGLATDPWGNERALFTASTRLDREDWGITWNQALETGGVLVSKAIDVEIEVQALRAS